MPKKLSRFFLFTFIMAAAIIDGLLAGGNVDRALIARPAWTHLGLTAWADYTRNADLANGRFFYPAMAFSGTMFCVLAAAIGAFAWRSAKHAALPVFLAAALMLTCLPISLKAAPFILKLDKVSDTNLPALADAFAGSYVWSLGQTILHSLAFLVNLWSLSAVSQQNLWHEQILSSI
jgi:hypothetical protein